MYQPFAEGALYFVNFFAVVKSLLLAWISRLLSSTTDSWKAIPNYYFNNYGGLKFLLKCNYNVSSINNSLPTFYRELLEYFQEFKEKTNIFSYGKFLLWNNEAITIDKNTLFLEILVQEEHPLCTRYPKCRWKLPNIPRISR